MPQKYFNTAGPCSYAEGKYYALKSWDEKLYVQEHGQITVLGC